MTLAERQMDVPTAVLAVALAITRMRVAHVPGHPIPDRLDLVSVVVNVAVTSVVTRNIWHHAAQVATMEGPSRSRSSTSSS